jgi:hypothetical protein
VNFAKTSRAAGGQGVPIDAMKLRSLLPGIRLPYDNYPGVKWAGVADGDGEIVGGDGGNYRKAREAVTAGTVLGGAPLAAAALHIPEARGSLSTRTRPMLFCFDDKQRLGRLRGQDGWPYVRAFTLKVCHVLISFRMVCSP